MEPLQKEIQELKGFIAELKADRAAQKEKEQRESWTKHTSLSLVFVAVLAAIATQWSGRYSNRVLAHLNDSTFYQTEASDLWSFYQAKSVKQNLYELAREQAANPAAISDPKRTGPIDRLTSKIEKYDSEKKEIQAKARQLEKQREEERAAANAASGQGSRMGLAVSVFQVSIAVGSICLVTKKKELWYVSLLLATIASAEMLFVWLR